MNRAWRFNQTSNTFWNDLKIRELSEDGRTLGIYFLTSPDASGEGFYVLPRVLAMDHLHWHRERFEAACRELEAVDFAAYDDRAEVVLILKGLKYKPVRGDKSIKGALSALDRVHDAPALFDRFLAAADKYEPEFAGAIRAHYGLVPHDP